MKTSPYALATSANPSGGTTPVTREMVNTRTHELALRAGRIPPHVSQRDYEQAKRELTGESDTERQEAVLDANRAPLAANPHPTPASGT